MILIMHIASSFIKVPRSYSIYGANLLSLDLSIAKTMVFISSNSGIIGI
jgi:hypothetical protein